MPIKIPQLLIKMLLFGGPNSTGTMEKIWGNAAETTKKFIHLFYVWSAESFENGKKSEWLKNLGIYEHWVKFTSCIRFAGNLLDWIKDGLS